MSRLLDLQRQMQASVLRSRTDGPIGDSIISTPAADASRRLGVYVHAYRARLLEVLGNDFPGLRALAGAATFEQLGLAYIEATPSSHANVRWYGGALADFLHAASPWAEQPELSVMAALEWDMGLAFDAAVEKVVDAAEVATVAPSDWPAMGLHLHGSLRPQSLRWNVITIRRAVDRDECLPPLVEWNPPQSWIVWRKDTTVRYRHLDDDEAAALEAIARGASFAQVCELLCRFHPVDVVASRAATLFRRWVDDQWVIALYTTGTA
ncbi:MAG: DNA-binding domain-containing protein [Dokdonella sp.]